MGSGRVQISISFQGNDKNRYRPLDTIYGEVKLRVAKEISVEEVAIVFNGTAHTEVTQKTYSSQVGVFAEDHLLVERKLVVFPPENVRNVSQAKEFTMTPGDYDYGFQFKIPLMNECSKTDRKTSSGVTIMKHGLTVLPPSMMHGLDEASIRYKVQVIVKTASHLKRDIKESKGLLIESFDLIDEILTKAEESFLRENLYFENKIQKRIALTEKQTGRESYRIPIKKSEGSSFLKSVFGSRQEYAKEYGVPFTFEVRAASQYFTIGKVPDLKFFITSKYGSERYKGTDGKSSGLGEFLLTELQLSVIYYLDIFSLGATNTNRREFPITYERNLKVELDLANLTQAPNYEGLKHSNQFEMEIPKNAFKVGVVPDVLKPSFDVCNIKFGYKLGVQAAFKEDRKRRSSQKADINQDIKLITGIPPPTEYITMRQISPQVIQQTLEKYPQK